MYLALCDDEPAELARISDLLDTYREERLPTLRWSAFQSGFSLLSALDREAFDAVLLDIYLGDGNGMDVARAIRATNGGLSIVFLTSSPDFAVESYNVEASGYLLKPPRKATLFSVLDKLVARMEKSKDQGFLVKTTDGCIAKVALKRLMCLEARGHNGMLYLAGGECLKTTLSFSELAKQLCAHSNFTQTHRSYIVNLHYVRRIEKDQVVLLDGTELPLPRSRRQSVAAQFQRLLFNEMEWGGVDATRR